MTKTAIAVLESSVTCTVPDIHYKRTGEERLSKAALVEVHDVFGLGSFDDLTEENYNSSGRHIYQLDLMVLFARFLTMLLLCWSDYEI